MKNLAKLVVPSKTILCAVIFGIGGTLYAVRSEAQTGNNAVFSSGSACCQPSPAFIDASVFASSNFPDLCTLLNHILTSVVHTTYPYGAVIDARGLPFTTPATSMTCPSSQPSPWSGITSPPPSTILLPAGVIFIPSKWVLPSNTHLIGEGDGAASGAINTTIEVTSTSYSDSSILQFGSSAGASGISVERLVLNGLGVSTDGIVNSNAGDDSYVDHVNLYQIRGTGLLIENNARNSGPYTNIVFDTSSSYSGTTSTVCAQILNVGGTRGIHGLTCNTYSSDPPAAVLLDSSNNTIEDVTIMGFYDGIKVGANGTAQDNILRNISGDTVHGNGSLTPINAIHIESSATDLSIMGVTNSNQASTYTIQDDHFSPHLSLSDTYIAMYAIGNTGSGSYYSRFSTSPNVPSWVVGSSYPQGSCTQGSLYSCTGGYSNCGSTYYALWACAWAGSPTPTLGWQPVL